MLPVLRLRLQPTPTSCEATAALPQIATVVSSTATTNPAFRPPRRWRNSRNSCPKSPGTQPTAANCSPSPRRASAEEVGANAAVGNVVLDCDSEDQADEAVVYDAAADNGGDGDAPAAQAATSTAAGEPRQLGAAAAAMALGGDVGGAQPGVASQQRATAEANSAARLAEEQRPLAGADAVRIAANARLAAEAEAALAAEAVRWAAEADATPVHRVAEDRLAAAAATEGVAAQAAEVMEEAKDAPCVIDIDAGVAADACEAGRGDVRRSTRGGVRTPTPLTAAKARKEQEKKEKENKLTDTGDAGVGAGFAVGDMVDVSYGLVGGGCVLDVGLNTMLHRLFSSEGSQMHDVTPIMCMHAGICRFSVYTRCMLP